MIVFHLATSASVKNSDVFAGTNDSSAFHLMTLVVTRVTGLAGVHHSGARHAVWSDED